MTIDVRGKGMEVVHLSGGTLTSDFPVREEAIAAYRRALVQHLNNFGDDIAITVEVRERHAVDDGTRTSLEDFMREQGYSATDLG